MSHLSSEASPSRGPSWLARATAVVAVTGLALIGTSVAAEAHVTVDADSTASGSFSALTFRVPNESDTAGTVKVTTEIPQDTPLVYVSIRPVPGWKATTAEEALPKPITAEGGATITKAIRTITWTAEQGTQIAPGEYQDFPSPLARFPRRAPWCSPPRSSTPTVRRLLGMSPHGIRVRNRSGRLQLSSSLPPRVTLDPSRRGLLLAARAAQRVPR